ncbi:fibromodulin-like [Aplochiton taeniatus]
MKTVVLILVAALVDVGFAHQISNFQWLSYLRSRRRHPASEWTERLSEDCPLECDCPSTYPYAMYCHNRNLQHIPYVPSRMKYVYLQRNKITGIQEGVFANATNLVWVILYHNQLHSDKIEKNVFSNLKSLVRLHLEHNELTQVPHNLPKSIKDLRLNHNKISKILASSFEGMSDLTNLVLHSNAIEAVGGAFKELKSLTILDMRKNKLHNIPDNLPETLHQLYLGFNSIESVPADFFSFYPKLQFVRLAHNKLTDKGIPTNTFNVSTLLELDLSHNKLEKIPRVNRNLENLYLQANQIKEFSLSSFCGIVDMMSFSQIRVLRLDANEISAKDVPPEAAYCLRLAAYIDL